MSGLIRRFGKGMKRTFEFMEHEEEPLIDMAGGDIEMGVLGEEALTTVEALASVAAVPIAVLESPIVLAAGGVAMLLGLGEFFPGKRKRSPTGVIIPSAGGTSRAPPPRRPRVPGPSPEMPARKKVSKKVKGRKVPTKAKTQKSKRTVKKKTSSKKKPKKSPTYSVTIKQEVHGQFRRNNVSYFGFQATAGMAELFRVAADSIIRAFFKRHHVSIRRTDEVAPVSAAVPAFAKLRIDYQRTKYDDGTTGGADVEGTIHNFASGTYESHVTAIGQELEDKTRLGYFPSLAYTFSSNGTIILVNRKLGDAKLNLVTKRLIKLRNITKNDGGTIDTNALDTNPLQGRLYKFRHDVPRVTPSLYTTAVDDFSKFHDRNCTAGVIFGPQRAVAGDHKGVPVQPAIMGLNRVLSTPPPGGRVWDNLSSSKKIGLAPGQAALHKMSFKYSGTIRQFLAKFATSAYEAPSIGYCHLFGLEQKFKTDATDHINVEYDCDDVLKGSCMFVREDISPPTVVSVHAQNSVVV